MKCSTPPQTLGYKNEVIMAIRIIGAALWTGVWVVSVGDIVGWLEF